MSKTTELSKAYSRGYYAAVNRYWSKHKPPEPPNKVLANILASFVALRNQIDGEMATFEEDDEMVLRLDPFISRADESFIELSDWLAEPPDNDNV